MEKVISHVDEKCLMPVDIAKSETQEHYNRHYNKAVRGHVVISDDEGNILETPNLVVLSGREFLAQKLSDVTGTSSLSPDGAGNLHDLTKFKIRYFGVGEGGADTAATPNKVGPFDNELNLIEPGKFADVNSENFQYIHDGRMKSILSDGGTISIVDEDHEISINGESLLVEAFSTIKYTMFIRKDELYKEVTESGPFAFNEAALYAVDFEDATPAKSNETESSRHTPNFRMFARFTTMTKWLEVKDSLKIEWYILV